MDCGTEDSPFYHRPLFNGLNSIIYIGPKLILYFLENDTVSMMLKVVQKKKNIQLAAILRDHVDRNTITLRQLKIVVKEV